MAFDLARLNEDVLEWGRRKLSNDFYRFWNFDKCTCGRSNVVYQDYSYVSGFASAFVVYLTYQYPGTKDVFQYGIRLRTMSTYVGTNLSDILDMHLENFRFMVRHDIALKIDMDGGSFEKPEKFEEILAIHRKIEATDKIVIKGVQLPHAAFTMDYFCPVNREWLSITDLNEQLRCGNLRIPPSIGVSCEKCQVVHRLQNE